MKRIILIYISLTVCFSLYSQIIPASFYGYKLGDMVDINVLESLTGDVPSPSILETGLTAYFLHVSNNIWDIEWDNSIIILDKENRLVSCGVSKNIPLAKGENEHYYLSDPFFATVKKKMTEVGEVMKVDSTPNKFSVKVPELAIIIHAECYPIEKESEENIGLVSLTFVDRVWAENKMLQDPRARVVKDVQDVFMGLKLGSVCSSSSLASAFKRRGSYLYSKDEISHKVYVFADVSFAGRKWDYVECYLNSENVFYEFKAYDSFSTSTVDSSRADGLYKEYLKKLEARYGHCDESVFDDTIGVGYFGLNGVILSFSLEMQRSTGGAQRNFVILDYSNTQLSGSVDAYANEEL